MEDTITLTEAELNAKIEEAVAQKTKDLESKHNGEMANMRKELKAAKDANLSTDERIAKEKQEYEESVNQELTELRAYKKGKIIEERLTKEGLPNYLKNDSRLLNANDDEFDKAVKLVKQDYEANLPKGNQTSTVVRTATGTKPSDSGNEKEQAYGEFAEALENIVGK